MTTVRTVSPPGDLVAEELEARGWSQQTLAEVMGTSPTLVSEVVNAKRAITPDTAALIALAFGTSTEVWLGLEARYQASLAKPKKGEDAGRRAKLYAKAPLRAMIKRGWIGETKDLTRLEKQLLAFLEQGSLDEESVFDHAARKSGAYGVTTREQFAWLCRARHLARLLTVQSQWRPSRVSDLVSELRRLILSPPALQEMPRVLSEFGVRLVVVERLPGMKMQGATFWLSGTEPVIALSLTFDRIDNAWHTIMHEIGHVANKDRLAVDEEVLGRGDKPEAERRADEFAVQALVPQDKLDDFCMRVGPLYSEIRVIGFASLLRVHPGIVVGQLHHRGPENRGLEYSHFRKMLAPVRKFVTENALTDGWGKTVRIKIDLT